MVLKPSAAVANLATRVFGPTCRATVGGKALAECEASLTESSGSPRVTARCTWRIPPGAIGKLFRGSVKVAFRGKDSTRSIVARITK
jgi:hypothetical protein